MVDVDEARLMLGCRPGACGAEVQRAFRTAVRKARPDLDRVDGDWVTAAQQARGVLMAHAGPDRRRHRAAVTGGAAAPLRRATWQPDAEHAGATVDVRL